LIGFLGSIAKRAKGAKNAKTVIILEIKGRERLLLNLMKYEFKH
jgi:hypothetical protein